MKTPLTFLVRLLTADHPVVCCLLSVVSICLLSVVSLSAFAIDNNTVEIKYNGTAATVTVAPNISSYITNQSSGSHVKLVQSPSFAGVDKNADNEDGEIIYVLSGVSADGEFYLEGSYKCIVELDGLTLTNPSGPAINIQNGKRIEVSAKKGTTNTIADGANDAYNGCFHSKGHTKFKGKGTLNVRGNARHAIYSKEYIEVKNLTLNITAAQKDGLHCKEYFLMESGTVSISGTGDDGIQVEQSSDPVTGITTGHDDENSGNFYMTDGKLTISGYAGKAIKADGTITYSGGTQQFDKADTQIHAGIDAPQTSTLKSQPSNPYDLLGRPLVNGTSSNSTFKKGIIIIGGKKYLR